MYPFKVTKKWHKGLAMWNYQRTPIECHIRGNVMQDNCSPQRAENGKQKDTFLLWLVKDKMSLYHKLCFWHTEESEKKNYSKYTERLVQSFLQYVRLMHWLLVDLKLNIIALRMLRSLPLYCFWKSGNSHTQTEKWWIVCHPFGSNWCSTAVKKKNMKGNVCFVYGILTSVRSTQRRNNPNDFKKPYFWR